MEIASKQCMDCKESIDKPNYGIGYITCNKCWGPMKYGDTITYNNTEGKLPIKYFKDSFKCENCGFERLI